MTAMKRPHILTLEVAERWIDLTHAGVRMRFDFPAGLTWDRPGDVGKALAQFMTSRSITAKKVAVGLPTRWLIAQSQRVPSADAVVVNGALRLAVAQQYAAEAGRWSFDYLSFTRDKSTSALLVAGTEDRLTKLNKLLEAAHITPVVITSPALSAVMADNKPPRGTGAAPSAILRRTTDEISLVLTDGRAITGLSYIPTATDGRNDPQATALEINRAILNHSVSGASALRRIDVQDLAGGGTAEWSDVAAALSMELRPTATPMSDADAIAWAASHRKAAVDFTQPRLATEIKKGLGRKRMLALAALAALALGAAVWVFGWYRDSGEARDIRAYLVEQKKPLEAAQVRLDRLDMIRGWYDHRPAVLDTIRNVSVVRPTGSVWLTSLSIRDDATATLAGRATDEASVFDFRSRLEKVPGAGKVGLLYSRQAERGSAGVSFALSLGVKR